MWSEQLDLDAAVASLHVVYPSIAPNAGFRAQLELWQAMGCRVDPQHEAYKRLSLQTLGDSWAEHGSVAQESLPEPEAASSAQVGINCFRMRECIRLQTSTVEQKRLPEAKSHLAQVGLMHVEPSVLRPEPAATLLVHAHKACGSAAATDRASPICSLCTRLPACFAYCGKAR